MSYSAAGYEFELNQIEWVNLIAVLSLDICVEHYGSIGLPLEQADAFLGGLRVSIEEFEDAARFVPASDEAVFRMWALVQGVFKRVEVEYGPDAVRRLCRWAEDVYCSAQQYRRWGPYEHAMYRLSAKRDSGESDLPVGTKSTMFGRFRELMNTENIDIALKRSREIPPSDWDRRILKLRGCLVRQSELGVLMELEEEAIEYYQDPFETILTCVSKWRFVRFLIKLLDELNSDEISLLQKYASERVKRPVEAPEALARRVRSYW